MDVGRRTAITRAISRTFSLVVIAILVVAGALAFYYFGTPGGAPSTTHGTNAFRSTIVIGTTDSIQSTIDPADAYDYFAGSEVLPNIDDGLVDYKPGTSQYVPALATDWSTSSDGLVWTFNLRQGVKFADGTPFNATVVKYSIDRSILIDESTGPYAGSGLDQIIKSAAVTGPYQVQITLNTPFGPFLGFVAFSAMFPVNPKVAVLPAHPHTGTNIGVINYTGNVATENPTGLGAYQLTNWVRSAGKDVEMDFAANPNYWNATNGWPKTPNILVKFYSDSTALALALKNGEVDIAYRQVAPTDLKSFSSSSSGFRVTNGPGTFIQFLDLSENFTDMKSQTVRQALAAAVNRSAIVTNVFQGQAKALYSMIPAGMLYHADSWKDAYGEANIAMAQSLLQKAGFSAAHPLKISLYYPTGHYSSTDGIALQLKQAFEKTGMILVDGPTSQPWSNYKASTRHDQLEVSIYGWYPDYVDPYDYSYPFFPSDGNGGYRTHWVNSTVNSLIARAAGTTSSTTLQQLYTQIQQATAQQSPYIPLFQGASNCVSNPKVTGIVLDITIYFRYWLLQETT